MSFVHFFKFAGLNHLKTADATLAQTGQILLAIPMRELLKKMPVFCLLHIGYRFDKLTLCKFIPVRNIWKK